MTALARVATEWFRELRYRLNNVSGEARNITFY
jgi:hypothetical protein